MTLRDWLDSYTLNGDAQLVCAWRKRAWRSMRPVVRQFVQDREAGLSVSVGNLLAEIDAAGARARINALGKRWKQERTKLIEIAQRQGELWPAPTKAEAEVCLVALDLVEMGRHAEASALLREQAPNARSRVCRVCGSKPGDPCLELVTRAERVVPHEVRYAA